MTQQLEPLDSRIAENFKAYDIRGVVPQDLDSEQAYRIGRALVAFLNVDSVVVGRDMRISSEMLTGALIDGIRDQGADVTDIGMVSSDALYFAAGKFNFPAGVMTTASHNPAEYNGFKICREEARALSLDTGIGQIRDMVISGDIPAPASGKRGDLTTRNVLDAYAEHVLGLIEVEELKPLKVAIDAGNGMGGVLMETVGKYLPFTILPLYFEPDGTFPNHEANPIEPENIRELQETVVREECDLGVAFDGDADRMFLIDEHGVFIGGDMTTAMVSIEALRTNPGASIVHNLICSRTVPEVIARHGGRAIRSRVGHSFIKALMREEDAIFGGEHSGHFYFRDNWSADSGLIAFLTVAQLISRAGKPLSEVLAPIDTRFRSGEINSEVASVPAKLTEMKEHFGKLGAQMDELDGLTVEFDSWWFNVRGSNTQPLLRLNVEADTQEELTAKTAEVLKLIRG